MVYNGKINKNGFITNLVHPLQKTSLTFIKWDDLSYYVGEIETLADPTRKEVVQGSERGGHFR